MKTYGVVWPSAGEVVVEEYEIAPPAAHELQVEVTCTAVSPGTERARLLFSKSAAGPLAAWSYKAPAPYPQRPGYSVAGRVIAVGESVQGFAVGDRVVAAGPHAAHANVDSRWAAPVPDGVDLGSAVFFHLAMVALHAVRKVRVELGAPVAVVGQGLIGILTTQVARVHGAVPIFAIDLNDDRLKMSAIAGADILINPEHSDPVAEVKKEIPGGIPAVFQTTGSSQPTLMAAQLLAPRGSLALVAGGGGDMSSDIIQEVSFKGASLVGMPPSDRDPGLIHQSSPGLWTFADNARTFLDLLRYKRIDVEPFVTHRVPGSEAPELYELVKSSDARLIGAILDWQS